MNSKQETIRYSDHFLVENIPNLLCIKDGKGRWLQASRSFLGHYNLNNLDYAGKTDYQLSQEKGADVLALYADANQEKKAWNLGRPVMEKTVLSSRRGQQETVEFTRTPVFDENGEPFRLLVTGRIVTQSEQEITRLRLNASIFDCKHIGIVFFDLNFKVITVNRAFSILTGIDAGEVKHAPISSLFKPEHGGELDSVLTFNTDDEGGSYCERELICLCKNKDRIFVKFGVTTIHGDEGKPTHYCATLVDMTKQKQSEERFFQIAHSDDLTGIGNRIMFFDQLTRYISAAKRHKLFAIVFFIDLDRFKAVNDSMGHDAGDELLKEVALRLTATVRKHDVVARLSGDEFAVLILNEKSHENAIFAASLVAEKIIGEISKTFNIQRQQVFIGSSVGIAIFPEDGETAEILLKNADLAMYQAKNSGRNKYQFFKHEYAAAIKNKIELESDLRKAIERNELQLFYQPQYELQSGRIWGAEALIRWFHGESGSQGAGKMIPPDYFIPVAEDTGLIIEIGKWIIETACRQLYSWIELGYPIDKVAVNISARQFMDNGFLETVEEALSRSGLSPENLELEITESMLIGDTRLIELKLNRLKKRGISIALDDFGTGYSSLSYLKKFPIDVLKIDQSFVREMTEDSKDARIACAIIEMGHSLGQKIIAEGVENEDQMLFLNRRSCDVIQGYFLSQPLPSHKMSALLQQKMSLNSESIVAG
ncbi:MAG: sensor domain-containing protein [Gammaproteobacteria bacterium]